MTQHHPRLDVHYVEQPERLGLGHAISLAETHATGRPALIILGDTIFDADLRGVIERWENAIGVKEVEDPRRFGIVETDAEGRVTRMVEKPEHPTSHLAITGIYFFTDGTPLFGALRELQERGVRTRGEFQLTDGMQLLVERGATIRTFPVNGWYDCGKLETLLETNRVLLDRSNLAPRRAGAIIHPPVALADDAVVENAVIGPHVTVAAGAQLRNAVIRDTIINENATVEDTLLEASVVGENAVVQGRFRRISVGDSSEVQLG